MSMGQAKQMWEAALGQLQLEVTRANYETWLKDTVGLSYQGDLFTVGAPTTFATEWLEKRLHSLIKKVLIGIAGHDLDVQFDVCQTQQPEEAAPSRRYAYPENNGWVYRPKLNPRYTFALFVVGSCNRLAHAAALGVAENPGHGYNPLFIYGGVGLGKTHLLHAIGHAVLERSPRVIYVTSEQFTNEFINAIRERKSEEFRNKYRSVDVLLIDDIQFLAGKEQTQEGFFHTFNDLHNANRQIIVTSDRSPKWMPLLEDRLRSRFEWGLIADIQPPDLETRLAILQAKAREQRANVPQEVMDFIARKIQKDIRELEGSLKRVIAYANLTRSALTVELASQVLVEGSAFGARRKVTPPTIVKAVAEYFNIDPETLVGKRRDKQIALARQVAMYLIREETQRCWVEIGRELGGRDHSTILHGYEKIAEEINAKPQLRDSVLEIRGSLYSKGEKAS